MNRNYIHDIKPSGRTQKRREAMHRIHEKNLEEFEETFEPRDPYTRKSSGKGVWWVAALAIIILVFALTFVFAGATVFVTPRVGTVELSGPIVAEKESRNGLSFEMLSLDGSESTTVAAGTKQYVERKATGTVRLFNANAKSQNLLIDTRLETTDGHIYKTKKATTIPAQTVSGGKTTPGSIDVDIYADEAGDGYNKTDADFKVVGFRGSPKYQTVYARSTTPISGGFKGDTTDISPDELTKQKEALQATLTKTLLDKAKAQLPEDFIMYDKASLVTFDDPVVGAPGADGNVEISLKGKINAVIFKEEDLTKALVEKVIANTEDNKVTIPNIRDLNIELDKGSAVQDPQTMQDIKINIDDKIKVVWQIDDVALKDALVGIKKRDFESTMLQFKNIDRAELSLKPFWKMMLPQKAGAIKVVNTLDQTE